MLCLHRFLIARIPCPTKFTVGHRSLKHCYIWIVSKQHVSLLGESSCSESQKGTGKYITLSRLQYCRRAPTEKANNNWTFFLTKEKTKNSLILNVLHMPNHPQKLVCTSKSIAANAKMVLKKKKKSKPWLVFHIFK